MARCAEAALDDAGAARGLRSAGRRCRPRGVGRVAVPRPGAPGGRTDRRAPARAPTMTTDRRQPGLRPRDRHRRRGSSAASSTSPWCARPRRCAPAAPTGRPARARRTCPSATAPQPDERARLRRPAVDADRGRGSASVVPTNFYAMAETALRHRTGEPIAAHRGRIAELWAGASEVAAGNPDAWIRDALSAEQIATVTERNRPVAAPYPKLMVSNLDVDQGGAVVMCSAAAAEAAGVAPRPMGVPVVGRRAPTTTGTPRTGGRSTSRRRCGSPGDRALELAGRRPRRLRAARPVLVLPGPRCQVAQRELGIAPGAPVHDHRRTDVRRRTAQLLLHPAAHARRWHLLRDRAGAAARSSPATAATFTKHSMLVLAAEPAVGQRFPHRNRCSAEVDALPGRADPDRAAPPTRRSRPTPSPTTAPARPSGRCSRASTPTAPATTPLSDDAAIDRRAARERPVRPYGAARRRRDQLVGDWPTRSGERRPRRQTGGDGSRRR